MPAPIDPTCLVAQMLTARERLLAGYQDLHWLARAQTTCLRAADLDASRSLGRLFDRRAARIQAEERKLVPLSEAWLASDAIPQGARQRYEAILKAEVEFLNLIGDTQRLNYRLQCEITGGTRARIRPPDGGRRREEVSMDDPPYIPSPSGRG